MPVHDEAAQRRAVVRAAVDTVTTVLAQPGPRLALAR